MLALYLHLNFFQQLTVQPPAKDVSPGRSGSPMHQQYTTTQNLDLLQFPSDRRVSSASDSSGMVVCEINKYLPSTSTEQGKKSEHTLRRQRNVGGGEDLHVFKVNSSLTEEERGDALHFLPKDTVNVESNEKKFSRKGSDGAINFDRLTVKETSSSILGKRFSLQTPSLSNTNLNRPNSMEIAKEDDNNNNSNTGLTSMPSKSKSLFRIFDSKNDKKLPSIRRMSKELDNNNIPKLQIENHVGENMCNDVSKTKFVTINDKLKSNELLNKQLSTNSYLADKQVLTNDAKKLSKLQRNNTDYGHCNSLSKT